MPNTQQSTSLIDTLTIPKYAIYGVVVIIFGYILIYSLLQIRQLGILRKKVGTDIDNLLKVSSIAYLLVQALIFVVVLLML